MTSLNSKLQLALLNRKKGRNLIEKGFTLVELMIVIVIVGILSSVALPNFLSQQDKAKATEGTTTLSSILKTAYADYQAENSATDASKAATIAIASANKVNFGYTHSAISSGTTIKVLATGQEGLANKGNLGGCVDLVTGKISISKSLDSALTEATISCPT